MSKTVNKFTEMQTNRVKNLRSFDYLGLALPIM